MSEQIKKKAIDLYEKYDKLSKEDKLVVDGVMIGMAVKNKSEESKKD